MWDENVLFCMVLDLISPRRMHEGYGSRSVCECVCVCYRASYYIPRLYVQSETS